MRGWRISVIVAALTVATAAAGQTAGEAPGDEAAAARWLQATGHRLAEPEPTAAELAPIVSALSGARVIGLGEVTHGTHEDVAFKALLLRELVKAGAIDTLAIEANRVVGVGFDRYVRDGVGDPATLILSPSAFKIYKNDEFAGTLLWVRAWNLAHPDRTVGVIAIDDQDGAVDATFALSLVARHDPALAERLRRPFGTMLPPPGAARVRPSDWIAAHSAAEAQTALAAAAALRDTIAAHARDWGPDPDYAEAAYAARLVWQNVHVFEKDVKGADFKSFSGDYWSRRDRYMAGNLLERLGGQRRAALWAHDDHVMHTYTREWVKQGATGLGVEVRGRLGDAYRTLGFTYTRATVTATQGKDIDLAQMVAKQHDVPVPIDNSGPDSAGRVLARLPGKAWWFAAATPGADAAARRWLDRPVWNGSVGWIIDPAKFQKGKVAEDSSPLEMGFDVMVWFREMSPQHRWPVSDTPDAAP